MFQISSESNHKYDSSDRPIGHGKKKSTCVTFVQHIKQNWTNESIPGLLPGRKRFSDAMVRQRATYEPNIMKIKRFKNKFDIFE